MCIYLYIPPFLASSLISYYPHIVQNLYGFVFSGTHTQTQTYTKKIFWTMCWLLIQYNNYK